MDQKQTAEAKVMRGIINRHHKQALAERREAQAAAAPAKAPNPTTWSTKAGKRTKQSTLDREVATRTDANRDQWRKRHAAAEHDVNADAARKLADQARVDAQAARDAADSARDPALAKEQRALRKDQAQVGERWRNKLEGTPQTHEHASRTCQGALARLCKSGDRTKNVLDHWASSRNDEARRSRGESGGLFRRGRSAPSARRPPR